MITNALYGRRYKYNPNSDIYDTSAKFRTPSWTDRIMWRKGDPISLIEYGRVELWTSDHKPVRACFEISVRDQVRRDRAVPGPSKKEEEAVSPLTRISGLGSSFMKNVAWAIGVATPSMPDAVSAGEGAGGATPQAIECVCSLHGSISYHRISLTDALLVSWLGMICFKSTATMQMSSVRRM